MVETMTALLEALNNYGPVLVVVAVLIVGNGFFIWQSSKREERQNTQLRSMQDNHNMIVIPLLGECKECIASCKEVIGQNSTVIMSIIRGERN